MKIVFALIILTLLFSCNRSEVNEGNKTLKHLQKEFDSLTLKNPSINHEFAQKYNKTLELWEVPYVELYLQTNYGLTHIIVSGNEDSVPVVLLHGMNATSTMWYPNIKSFSSNNRVYAIDFILETGKINSNEKIENLVDMQNWFSEILSKLKLKKINLIGASQGGWQATYFAVNMPNKIKKLVLLSPAHAFKWAEPGFDLLRNISFTLNPKRKNLRKLLETLSENVDSINPVFIEQFYYSTKKTPINELTTQMQPFSNDELASLKMPVLLLIGDRDIFNSEESIERAEKLIPNVESHIIENSGHFITIDQAEIINNKTIDFLNK